MSSEALRLKELGNKALKKKDYKKALDFYEKAILLDPTETKFFFNSAITHFELKNFKVCIETCQKAVKIGRENSAGSELIAKCFAKEGQAQRELGNLRMAKLAYEKAQEEHKKSDYGKKLSEIEFAIKHLQMKEVVENLYKVVKIDRKGLGCVALKEIEIGTLILKEKPQCVGLTQDDVIQSFGYMSKCDQEEYLKLYNAYAGCQGFSEVFGIYKTNSFATGVGIKASRFNHSCSPNAVCQWEDGSGEIRAWSKIKAGTEITICYFGDEGESKRGLPMKRFKERDTRQNLLSSNFFFKCICELCQEEARISNDDKTYEKFENLLEKAKNFEEKIKQQKLPSPSILLHKKLHYCKYAEFYQKSIEYHKSEISCYKEMYELAQISKEPSRFMPSYYTIIIKVIGAGFSSALKGYSMAIDPNDTNNMRFFKAACQKFSKIGSEMSEDMCGSNSVLTKKWKERNDLERWMEQDESLWYKFY